MNIKECFLCAITVASFVKKSCKTNRDVLEDDIITKILILEEDSRLERSDIKVVKKDGFYLVNNKHKSNSYYLCYKNQISNQISASEIVTSSSWIENSNINTRIFDANKKLLKCNLTIESVYDEDSCVSFRLVNSQDYGYHSLQKIINIYDIHDMAKYKLDTCYIPNRNNCNCCLDYSR
jgi:hypothetical protein